MKLFVKKLMNSVARYFVRATSVMLLTSLLWQGISVGIDVGYAAPLLTATSIGDVVDRVTDKADREIDKAKSTIKDIDRSANNSLEKAGKKIDRSAESSMDDTKAAIDRAGEGKITSDVDANQSEQYSGDTPDKVRKVADRNSKQAEDFSKKTTEKAKNFFGF